MWRHTLFLVVVVAGSIGLSLTLIPRHQELALMHLKDGEYESALRRFEHQYFENEDNAAILVPLHDLYIREGLVNDATAVVESALRLRPTDMESINLALNLFRESHQPENYLRALQLRAVATHTAENLRNLAEQQAFMGDYEAESQTLSRLLELSQAGEIDVVRLAQLLVWKDAPEQAAIALESWLQTGQTLANWDNVTIFYDVLSEAKRSTNAYAVIASWLRSQSDPAVLSEALSLATQQALDGEAAQQISAALVTHPDTSIAWLDLLFGLGNEANARALTSAYLKQALAQGTLTISWRQLILAANRGDTEFLTQALGTNSELEPNDAAQQQLIAAAVANNTTTLAQAVLALLARTQQAHAPLAMAELSALAGDTQTLTTMLERLAAAPPTLALAQLRYAQMLANTGDEASAKAVLMTLPVPVETAIGAAEGIAGLYLKLGIAELGFAQLGPELKRSEAPGADRSWALLAAAAGASDTVLAWLRELRVEASNTLDRSFLGDLNYFASGAGADNLRLEIARWDYTATADLGSAIALAQVQIETLRLREAITTLQPHLRSSAIALDLYQSTLLALGKVESVRTLTPELQAALDLRIEVDGIASAKVIQLLYDLIAIEAHDATVPALARLAGADPQRWYYPFRQSAEKSGRLGPLLEHLREQLEQSRSADAPAASELHESYLADFQRLGGEQALPELLAQLRAVAPGTAPALASYYRYKEAALRAKRSDLVAQYLQARLEAGPNDNEIQGLLAEYQEVAGAKRALPHLRKRALRKDLSPQATTQAYYAFRDAAVEAQAAAQFTDHLRAALRLGGLETQTRDLYEHDLSVLAGASALIDHVAHQTTRADLTQTARSDAYNRMKSTALEAGATQRLIAYLEARLNPTPSDQVELFLLDELRGIAGADAVLDKLHSRLARANLTAVQRTETYARFKESALTSGNDTRFVDYIQQRLRSSDDHGPYLSDLRIALGAERAMPILRAHAQNPDLDDAQFKLAYYVLQDVSGEPIRETGEDSRPLLLEYLAQAVALESLSTRRREILEFDFARLAPGDDWLQYLSARSLDPAVDEQRREQYYQRFKADARRSNQIAILTQYLNTAFAQAGTEQRADFVLDELLAALGPLAMIERLEQRAARSDLSAQSRSDAYFRFKKAALASANTERLLRFIERRVALAEPNQDYLAELREVAGDDRALPTLRSLASRTDLDLSAAERAYYAFQEAAISSDQTAAFVQFLQLRLREPKISARAKELYEYDLARFANESANLAYLETRASNPNAALADTQAYFARFKEAAIGADQHDRVSAFLVAQLDVINADTAPSKQQLAIFYLDELAASTSPSSVIERWRARALSRELSVAQREQAYFRLKDLATAAGRQDIVATFLEDRLRSGDASAQLLQELAAVGGDKAALPYLLVAAERRDVPESERTQAYYAYQEATLRLEQRSAFVSFLLRALAGNTLASKEQDLYEYDLERLGSPALVLKYLATQLLRANTDPETRIAYFSRYKAVATTHNQEQQLTQLVRAQLDTGLPAQLQSFYLAELQALDGPQAVLERLLAQARATNLTLEQRQAAYFRLKQAALAAGREDLITAYIEDQLRTTTERSANTAFASELRAVAGDERALPYLRAQAERADLASEDLEVAYYTFQEAAISTANTAILLEFLEAQLSKTHAQEHPLTDVFRFALARVGGPARVLPFLAQQIEHQDTADEDRLKSYYSYRDMALRSGEQVTYLSKLGDWLQSAPGGAPVRKAWLFDLRENGGTELVLPFLITEAEQAQARDPVSSGPFYALVDAAIDANRKDALLDFLARAMGAPETPPELESIYIDSAVLHGGPSFAAALIKSRANADPQRWSERYLGFLTAANQAPQVLRYMRQHGTNKRLPTKLRSNFADRLVASGHKQSAIEILQVLVDTEGLYSPALSTLTYLWGPRPGRDAVTWIERHANAASGINLIAWTDILMSVGASDRAIALLRPNTVAKQSNPLQLEAYVQALQATRNKAELNKFLTDFIRTPPSTPMLRWAGTTAEDAALTTLASTAWRKFLRARPNDLSALRRLGVNAFAAGRRQEAEITLRRYIKFVDNDYEPQFLYAELLAERGFTSRAEPIYRTVLTLIAKLQPADFRARTVRAQTLQRVGEVSAAVGEFRTLLAERPQAGHLRADYIATLLDNQRLRLARQVAANGRRLR